MDITVTIQVEDEFVDSGHDTGLTEAGYVLLTKRIAAVGSVIDVVRADGDLA